MAAPPTDVRTLDESVHVLRDRKDEWASLPVDRRIDLLRQCLDRYVRTAPDVVAAGCAAKGVESRSAASGEEWMSGPIGVIRQLRLFIETLSDIRRTGYPTLPAGSIHRTPTGELAVTVFPRGVAERVMYPGTRIDVWMQPEVDEGGLRDTMATTYRREQRKAGRVCAVLGAGNVASIAPTDALYKLVVEHQVVVVKMHPVNDYIGPLLERAFEPLIRGGYLRIVYGDAAEGQYLIHHEGVDEAHMTGSTAVHDRIVWGDTPDEQSRRRSAGQPKVAKRVTSELGCVTPAVVVPGRWSEREMQYQAENVATMVSHSASCTCTSARVLVTWSRWPQRLAFLDRVAAILARHTPRRAYYPGSAAKYQRLVGSYPQTKLLCDASANTLAPAVIYGLDPSADDGVAFSEEAWSPVLAETPLDAGTESEFIVEAVRFCNEQVSGTLSMVMLVSPETRSRLGAHFDRAVSELRYGTVSINHWSALSFVLGNAPWGAYPGHRLEDVGSGIGVVHNTSMFDRPLKTVVRGPLTGWPKPAWFTTHRRGHLVGRRIAGYEASPSLWHLPGIASAAARSG